MLRLGGFLNMTGTRYHPFELYGHTLDTMDPDLWKVLVRSSLTVKSGKRLLPGEFPAEDEVELHFPEILSYKYLRQLFFENYESFMCQQQNDPQGGHIPTFDEQLYKSILEQPQFVPVMGDTFMCWRLPNPAKQWDHAEGAAARVFNGKVHIIDAWSGVYTPSRLAEKIVREAKRLQSPNLLMEAVPGSSSLEPHIRNESYRKNVNLKIQWLEYDDDDTSRNARISGLEPTMRSGRVLISSGVSKHNDLRSQLLHFKLMPQNGIVDCVSRLAAKIPVSILRTELAEEELALQEKRRQDAMQNMVFGQQGLQAIENQRMAASLVAMNRVNSLGLPDILGGLDG
jgi:hypothetical protein